MRTPPLTGTRGDSKQNSRAASMSGLRSSANVSRADSQAGSVAGSGARSLTDTVLVEVTASCSKGPSTAKVMTGLPKKSRRSVQLVGVGSTTSSLAVQC